MTQIINGREYKNLPDSFLYDLKIELGIDPNAQPGQLPAAYDREYPQTFQLTKTLQGQSFRTVPGEPPRIIATWCYPRPDGSVCTTEATIPEEVRAQLASVTLTGDEMVTAVYDNTLPIVLAAFNADWGVVP